MSAEAPPATGIELFHVDGPLAASQEPTTSPASCAAFDTLR
jgi:hypothetical protein